MMWVQNATKDDLQNIILANRLSDKLITEVRTVQELPIMVSDIQLLWRDDPRKGSKFPSVVIIDPFIQKQFFAWTATYLPYCRPLTTYCRVISRKNLNMIGDSLRNDALGELEPLCIGLILGETATYVAGISDFNRLSMASFEGTYSFIMTRSITQNVLLNTPEQISDLWYKARELTGQKLLSLKLDDLNDAWKIVAKISGHYSFNKWHSIQENETIANASREILEKGNISDASWYKLTRGLDINISHELSIYSREERVRRVERALRILSHENTIDKMLRSFIGGYLASRIAPGTFEHHELLIPYLLELPSLILWYGMCAGLPKDSKLRNFGFGIGRKIIRDALQEDMMLNKPRCDIALEELEVLAGGENWVQYIQPKESGHLVVELLPCVNCTMRNINSKHYDSNKSNLTQHTIFSDNREGEIEKLLLELDRSLKSVDRIRDRIGEIAGFERKKGRGNKAKN